MKLLSKSIYIISNILKVFVSIPAVVLILLAIIFPFVSSNFEIKEDSVKIFSEEVEYKIENNVLTMDNKNYYIDSSTDIKEFVDKHDNKFFMTSIEYVLVCASILAVLTVLILHNLNKLYKNFYINNTPFTIENEKLMNKTIIFFVVEAILMKVTGLLYSIIAHVDLSIDFSLKDVIEILVILSIIYLFKYGRLLQADSNAKIYDK